MEADTKSEAANRRLNDLVAVTVVILTVFMAISKVKDDNINQAMQKAKSESVDAWAEYQAARIKLHMSTRTGFRCRACSTQPNSGQAATAPASGKGENRKFLSVGWSGSASKRRAICARPRSVRDRRSESTALAYFESKSAAAPPIGRAVRIGPPRTSGETKSA